jgi:small subunit ribosomal protein S17
MNNIKRKKFVGKVVSNSMNKTAVVSIEWRQRHLLYGKQVKRITKAYAHDENNQCHAGDLVAITETRPLSKTKRWRIVEILQRQALSSEEANQLTQGDAPEAQAANTEPEQESLNGNTNEK